MHLIQEIRYDAPRERVFAMLVDPAFQDEKCVATGAISHEVSLAPAADGGIVITTRRVLPTDTIPDSIRALVGATLSVVQVERWGPSDDSGTRSGTVTVDIAGAPVRLSGTLALRPDGAGTLEVIEGEVKASVPFIGAKIEQATAPAIVAGIRAEHRAGLEWLAR